MKEWFTQLLSPTGTVSSKRLLGLIGGLNLYIHTWFRPMMGEELNAHIMLIIALLGAGAVVDILKKDKGDVK